MIKWLRGLWALRFETVFDIAAGPFLDKDQLQRGIRVGSMRRSVVALFAWVVAADLLTNGINSWIDVAAIAVVIYALDLQRAISVAPGRALDAVGGLLGGGVARVRSAYRSGRSLEAPTTDVPEAS